MKFYTAEMINAWNQNDAGQDNEMLYRKLWEDAQDGYESHYRRLTDNLPVSVKKFSDAVLHNESVVSLPRMLRHESGCPEPSEGLVEGFDGGDEYTIVVAELRERMLHVVTYTLEMPPAVKLHSGPGFDPPENVAVWLYDEFDVDDMGRFTHNILFSNGVEIILKFKMMHWYECQMQVEG